MDTEGVAPARQQYERFGVTFPALVDPNYATRFEYVPWVFFVDEHGVVLDEDWKDVIKRNEKLRPVTDEIRAQWSPKNKRLSPGAINALVTKHLENPEDLGIASDLASRYVSLERLGEARALLKPVLEKYDPLEVARSGDREKIIALADAYIQLSRAETGREAQARAATMAYYIYPTKGYVKQVVRIEGPDHFDKTADGLMDSTYRSANIQRLVDERKAWFEAAKGD